MKRIFVLTVGFCACMRLMAQSPISFYPMENSQDVNIDTHLVIEFDKVVTTGSKGVITVTDKTTHKVVDRIDMSIPAGPTKGQPRNPMPDILQYPTYTRREISPTAIPVLELRQVQPRKISASIRRPSSVGSLMLSTFIRLSVMVIRLLFICITTCWTMDMSMKSRLARGL